MVLQRLLKELAQVQVAMVMVMVPQLWRLMVALLPHVASLAPREGMA